MGINGKDQMISWAQRPETQKLVARMEKEHPEPHIPTPEEIEGYKQNIKYHICKCESSTPKTPQSLSEEQRELRDTSNELPNGTPDKLAEVHQKMNKMPPNNPVAVHPIDKLVRQEIADARKAGKIPYPRSGWGRWKNQTREEYSKRPQFQRAIEKFINAKFAQAEYEDNQERNVD